MAAAEYRRLGGVRGASSEDGSSREFAIVEVVFPIPFNLLDAGLLLVVGGDGRITEGPDVDSVRPFTLANCPSVLDGKHSTIVGPGPYRKGEEGN